MDTETQNLLEDCLEAGSHSFGSACNSVEFPLMNDALNRCTDCGKYHSKETQREIGDWLLYKEVEKAGYRCRGKKPKDRAMKAVVCHPEPSGVVAMVVDLGKNRTGEHYPVYIQVRRIDPRSDHPRFTDHGTEIPIEPSTAGVLLV